MGALVLALGLCGSALASTGGGGLSGLQRSVLHRIAGDTWRFYGADVDPVTHLPLDNLGPGACVAPTPRRRTSASTCGRWSPPTIWG